MASDYVRNRRKELGLTQQQLAAKADVSVKVVQKFEANRPYDPIHTTFAEFFRALGVDVTYAFLELEWPKRKE
ncbi:helix-turn-helix transcriptional regulator [Brevibacillus reuszeri]|uniref:helix-turn-helix transcriptional regulator n=1 Tax=Brevibacillus reuszeri TaxID=54915 RepID=UPI000CCBFA5E|nr:helix-turn-helix domain-containing protein [Brevibacillus reuszeri]